MVIEIDRFKGLPPEKKKKLAQHLRLAVDAEPGASSIGGPRCDYSSGPQRPAWAVAIIELMVLER
jgi:hypothetical protein